MSALVGLSTGCGTLYSETRDKQGQAAKEAWGKVDLTAQIAVPRKNEAALLAKQLEVVDALAKARRDQTAWGMVLQSRAILDTRPQPRPPTQVPDNSVRALLQVPIEDELNKLTINSADAARWLTALAAENDAKRGLDKFQTEFQRYGLEMPSCDQITSKDAQKPILDWIAAHSDTQKGPAMEGTRVATLTQCAVQLQATQTLTNLALSPGLLQTTRQTRIAASDALSALRTKSLNRRNDFQVASAAYNDAAAKLAANAPGARDEVQAAAKKVQVIASDLEKLEDAFSVHFVAEKKQQSVDQLLATVLNTPAGTAPAADSSKAAMALVLFPDLVDKAKESLADAKKPNLLPLLMLKNLAQVNADAAARDIDTQTALVALLQAKLDWQTARARSLSDASKLLSRAAGVSRQPLTQVLAPSHGSQKDSLSLYDKIDVWNAASLYLDDIGRLQAEAGKVDYQINAIKYERTLVYAEANIAQWNTLITSSIDEMAEFGASGIKKEDVIALLNSLTLLWIGVGVN